MQKLLKKSRNETKAYRTFMLDSVHTQSHKQPNALGEEIETNT